MKIDTTIPNLMYEYIQNKPPKIINRISPSMLGRCMRTHYWTIKHLAQTTPPNPGALLNFEVGFLWEKIITNALQYNQVPFFEQYKLLDDELNVEGTLDFCPIVDTSTGEVEVWDSKTEGMMAANYRKHEQHTFFEHHPEYVMQLSTYALLLLRQGFKVKRGRFGIIIKDNGMIQEETVIFTEDMFRNVLNRIVRLNDYLANDKLPPCECEGWQIGYCNYGDVATQEPNSKGKIVNKNCCSEELETARVKGATK